MPKNITVSRQRLVKKPPVISAKEILKLVSARHEETKRHKYTSKRVASKAARLLRRLKSSKTVRSVSGSRLGAG